MDKVLTNDLLKYLLILGAGAVAIMAIIARLIGTVKGSFKQYQKSTIIYILVAAVFFAIVGLAAIPGLFSANKTAFLFLQAYFLLAGSAHVYFLNKSLAWAGEEKTFLSELLFTLLLWIIGCMLYLLIHHKLNKNGFEYIMAAASLFFIVPFFFYNTFQRAIAIPPKILKQWYYPVGIEIEEPDDSKMRNLIVISFEFQKSPANKQLINFRAKAPRDMDFGQLFYYFINDYNAMNTNSTIQFSNEFGEPHGWIFYKKQGWYSFITKYIDTEKTVLSNKIKENDVIICSRMQT
ncbi:MAG: TssN family type VI secretion system protein [Ferruginibacter sp.]